MSEHPITADSVVASSPDGRFQLRAGDIAVLQVAIDRGLLQAPFQGAPRGFLGTVKQLFSREAFKAWAGAVIGAAGPVAHAWAEGGLTTDVWTTAKTAFVTATIGLLLSFFVPNLPKAKP